MPVPFVSFEVKFNHWARVIAKFEPAVSVIIRKTTFDAYTGSQIAVPVDTTALKNSGQMSFPATLEGEIAYHMYYAGYVHEGTFRMPARRFLADAVESCRGSMLAAFQSLESQLL